MNDLMLLIKRYNLEKHVLKWAGSFRYLRSLYPEGFNLETWTDLNTPIDNDIARTLTRILEKEKLITITPNNMIIINDDLNLQRALELISVLVNINLSEFQSNNMDLLWTISNHQISSLPTNIVGNFRYLYTWIQEIILTSSNRVIFLAPYFTESGVKQLLTSFNAMNNFKKNICIDFLVNDIEEKNNLKAFNYLEKSIKLKGNNRIRIFEPVEKRDNKLWFHAKLLLVDNKKGYLGSANYSESGLSSQFELGVPLTAEQTKSLTKLINFWLANNYFKCHKQLV